MSNYDGQNPYYGGAGGGFVNNGSPYGSQDSPGGGRKGGRGNQTIRPVTIKQVIAAQQLHADADFTIDGVEVSLITMVGSVRNSSTSATNVSYEVGDGTGYIDVRVWLDSADDETGKTKDIEQDHYVSMMGSIKVFGGKRHVSATHIRRITDHNEIAHHMLKALHISLTLRGVSAGSGQFNAGAGAGAGASHNDYNVGSTTTVTASAWEHLPPLERKIMDVLNEDRDNEEGMHCTVIQRAIGGNEDNDNFTAAMTSLGDDGLIFSTIDEAHFKIAM
ncbi:hypothetical protein IAT38_005179 [Cryptococcus sp. DSM 104549]